MKTGIFLSIIILLQMLSNQLFASINSSDNDDSVHVEISATTISEDWLTIEDATPQLSAEGRIPVLMVHGWSFDGKPAPPGTDFWNPHINFILNDPELSKYIKPYFVKYYSNAITVNELGGLLRDKMQLAGLHETPFIIIAHSMGGLVSRSFMNEHVFTTGKYAGISCGELAKLIITLGTPHHGSPMANGPARDEKVSFFLKLYMSAIESFVFSETKYNEVNRSDLRWDNYDNLLNYSKYPAEKNDWLTSLNIHTKYDSKLICYVATVTGQFLLPPYNSADDQYKVGAYVIKESFNYDNDGIVPYQSAGFEGHTPKKIRYFNEYNHTDIARGKNNETVLFNNVKEDFLEVIPPRLIWPSETGLFLKHSESRKILWESPLAVNTINIYFSGDNGQTYTQIANNIEASLGSYEWSVPDTNLSQCIIRITKANDESLYSQSAFPFTIYHNKLVFLNPLSNNYFVPDKLNPIRWKQTGISNKVKITYRDPKNTYEEVLTEDLLVNQQINTYEWQTKSSVPLSDSAIISIQMLGMEVLGDTEIYNFHSTPFTMLGLPEVKIIAPSGNPIDIDSIYGEKMVIGSNYSLKWQTEGEIKYIRISLCDSAKNEIQEIKFKNHFPGIHSNGSYTWKVPELYGDNFFLRIDAGLNANTITASSFSTHHFRINQQSVIISPTNNNHNVSLLPCLVSEELKGSTAYFFEIKDSATNGSQYKKTFKTTSPIICLPNSTQNELMPGNTYSLKSWALFDSIKSFSSKLIFHTQETPPASFSTIKPLKNEFIWDDIVEFSWSRSVGSQKYMLELKTDNTIIFSEILNQNDTTSFVNMNVDGYSDTIFWKVTAQNQFGETSSSNFFFNKDLTNIYPNQLNTYRLTCYPNPVHNHASFHFSIPEPNDDHLVNLSVYNITGQRVIVLLRNKLISGNHSIEYKDFKEFALRNRKGLYIAVLEVDGVREIMKFSVE